MRPDIEDGFARSCYAAPDRIIVATALSDLEYLAPHAIAHAEAAKAELVFLHAIAPDAPPAKATYYNPLKADRDARLTLEVLARHVRLRNIACRVAVRHGHPADVIDEFLREHPSGRLMIGSHAVAGHDSNRVGSTSEQILLQTPIPVCVTPAHLPTGTATTSPVGKTHPELLKETSGNPRVILYPVGEFGPQPEGVRFALDVAQYFHAELILLQISKQSPHLAGPLPISCSAGLWPRMRLVGGTDGSVAGLLAAAREYGAEMILMEAPPSLASSSSVPATLAGLIASVPCQVLTFPVLPRERQNSNLHVLAGLSSRAASPAIGAH